MNTGLQAKMDLIGLETCCWTAEALTAIAGLDFISTNNRYLGFCRVQQQVFRLQ